MVVKLDVVDYEKKFEDFRDSSLEHLEDYDIDNIEKYTTEFLKYDKPIVKKVIRFDIMILTFISIAIIPFYFACFYVFNTPYFKTYFWYFELTTIAVVIMWFYLLSPLRTHEIYNKNGKRDDKLFLKYRGIITPGTSIKKQLSDNKKGFVMYSCLLISIILLYSVLEDNMAVNYLNLIYGAYTGAPIGSIASTIPVVLLFLLIASIIGFMVASSYDHKDLVRDQKIGKFRLKKLILIVIFLTFLVTSIILMVLHSNLMNNFWTNSNVVTTKSWADFNAIWTTIVFYMFMFLGIIGIGIMIALGFSGIEGGYIKMLYRQKIDSLPPEENNWEYHKTIKRHKEEKECFNKTRRNSAIELLIVIALAVGGYWTLWLADEHWNNPTLYNLMIAELAVVVLWVFIFSAAVHYKRERKYYHKDPHQNFKTLEFEERGLGSWKTYYREDIKKRKVLITYLVYFNILGLWGLSWNNGGGEGVVEMIFNALGLPEAAAVPALIVFYCAWNLTFLTYTSYITINNNSTEGKIYKALLLLVICLFTLGTYLLITVFEDRLQGFNWLSMDFILGLTIVTTLYLLLAIILVIFIFPVAIRFDTFEVVKKDIIVIMISTIVLISVMVAFFNFFLPMVDGSGSIIQHGYPFDKGADKSAQYLWNNFVFPHYLIGWYGYVWWGFVQQYLFMSYFLRLLTKIFPHSKGFIPAALSSCIFGIIHYPDWPLMLFTGLAGMFWAYSFQKVHTTKDGKIVRGYNLYLFGMIHGFGGTFVNQLIPISMSVGPFNA